MSKELYKKAQTIKLSIEEIQELSKYMLKKQPSNLLKAKHINTIIKIAKNNPYLIKYFGINKKISAEEKFYICKELLNHDVTIFNLVTTKLNIDLKEPITYTVYDDTKPNNKKKVELLDEIFDQYENTTLNYIKKMEKTNIPFNNHTIGTLLNNSLSEKKLQIFHYINDKYDYDFKLNPDLIFFAIDCPDYKNIIDICLNKGLSVNEKTNSLDELTNQLLCCAALENYDALTYLLEKGGNVNTQGFENKPLIIYVATAHTEKLYDFFRQFRPDLNMKINEEETVEQYLKNNAENGRFKNSAKQELINIKNTLDYEKMNNTFKNQKNTSKKKIL